MTIDHFRDRLIIFGATILGILVSLYCAKLAGTGSFGMLAIIVSLVGVAVLTLTLKENMWMIVPICLPLLGRIETLPLPFSVKDLAVLFTFVPVIFLIAFRVIRLRPKFSLLDALLYINCAWLLIVFIRNPVGLSSTDSDRVGGRPYFDVFIAFLAYWTIRRGQASVSGLRRLPLLCVAMVGFVFAVNILILLVPKFGAITMFYSGFDMSMMDDGIAASTAEGGRFWTFAELGRMMVVALCAYYVPTTLLSPVHWQRSLMFGFAMVGLLLSGFRSAVVYAGLVFIVSSHFVKGWSTAIRSVCVGVAMMYVVMLGHGTLYNLPISAQRALAFIPEPLRLVKLDYAAIENSRASTEWRTEMWVQALTTNRFIQNKVLGDGFGVSKTQYMEIARVAKFGGSVKDSQENMAIMGDFHSGPISAIRVTGYVGCVTLMLLIGLTARKAAKLIRECKGTPLFAPSLYFCVPLVLYPLQWLFIYGHYGMDVSAMAVGLGAMSFIENSLSAYRGAEEGAESGDALSLPELPPLAPMSAARRV